MDQNPFISAMMNDGNNEETFWDGMQSQEQPSPIAVCLASSKPMGRRSKNFTESEDIMLVSAWLNISMDAATGNEQSRDTYWKRIHDYFHDNKFFESDRNQSSLMHRWSSIQEYVNKFTGYYDGIDGRRQSGVTEKDKAAKERLNDVGDNLYTETLERQWANRKELEATKELKKEERYQKIYALEQEKIKQKKEAEEKKMKIRKAEIQLKTRLDDERIMSIDISSLSAMQQQYYIGLQKEIISKRSNMSG